MWINGEKLTSVSAALSRLVDVSESRRLDSRQDLEAAWAADDKELKEAQKTYRETLDRYIEGKATEAELNAAAEAAYGREAASRKEHLRRLGESFEEGLEGISGSDSSYAIKYQELGQEYAELIHRSWQARYEAELAGREAEWEQAQRDLAEKLKAWRGAAGLIFERGRMDWKAGMERMQESYTGWKKAFTESYETTSLAWDAAYLEGLKTKEAWVEEATEAAQEAATGAVLALVGEDAEAGARKLDTLMPVMELNSGKEEATAAVQEVLSRAGISRLSEALEGQMGSAGTATSMVQRGIGGPALWDSAAIQVAAQAFTKEANRELASRQARLVAAQAREMAEEAIKTLEEQVKDANEGFAESMDETFVMQGSWRKEGRYYRKDVVVYSTLMDPVVTEETSVEGYIAYLMAPVTLSVDLSDGTLARLDFMGVQARIQKAQEEVQDKSEELFGGEEDNTEEAKKSREKIVKFYKTRKKQVGVRIEQNPFGKGEIEVPIYAHETYEEESLRKTKSWGAGLFGTYIGYDPVLQETPDIEKGLEGIWQDSGMGELGRLMRSYIYWSIKESQGWSLVNQPMWDKPAWDDRDSWFKAPTIRGVADIGVTIAAAVVTAPDGGSRSGGGERRDEPGGRCGVHDA